MKLVGCFAFCPSSYSCCALRSSSPKLVTPNAKPPEELAKSDNKQLEANKTLVLNLFREILEAGTWNWPISIWPTILSSTIRTASSPFCPAETVFLCAK